LEHTTDTAIRLFREGWLQHKIADAGEPQRQAYRDRLQKITVADIISAAESDRDGSYSFRGWGLRADDAQLELVFEHLCSSQDVNVIANLLRVFWRRPLPIFDARLLDLCQHIDSDVRRWAFNAIHNSKHDLIRVFALSQLQKGVRNGSVISLFAGNYESGDEQRILSAIEFPDDDFELHSLLMSVLEVLDHNPDANAAQLGIIGYKSTPCGECRRRFLRALLRQNVAPGWLAEECRFDAVTRIVESITVPTGTEC
jgi:hypothetical protein